jgi:hypothetical protein
MTPATKRELSDAQVREQAEQLEAYVGRGGGASRWLDGKDFYPADRAAVLVAWTELKQESA